MNKINALESDILMRIYSDITQCAYENRILKQESEVDTNKYQVVNVAINLESDELFSIYKKVYKYFVNGYVKFIDNIFILLDSVDDIETTLSVTTQVDLSIYKTKLQNIDTSSYSRLSKITLLEHIDDIIILLIEEYEENMINNKKEWLTLSEMQQLLLLALVHDVGKIISLMRRLQINFSDKNHEERSVVFMQMILEGGDYGESTKKHLLKRLLNNLIRISMSKNNKTVERFLDYDIKSRVIELNKLEKKDSL